jgi:hypothetical protein
VERSYLDLMAGPHVTGTVRESGKFRATLGRLALLANRRNGEVWTLLRPGGRLDRDRLTPINIC